MLKQVEPSNPFGRMGLLPDLQVRILPVAARDRRPRRPVFFGLVSHISHRLPFLQPQHVNGALKRQRLGGDLSRIVKSGVLGRTRQFVTDIWFGRINTTVIDGEEYRCSRTWKNGLKFVAVC